jgi:hypothetical protein
MPSPAQRDTPGLAANGAGQLTAVNVDTYKSELRDSDRFIGERASRRAFTAILEDWRERLRQNGEDPVDEPAKDR